MGGCGALGGLLPRRSSLSRAWTEGAGRVGPGGTLWGGTVGKPGWMAFGLRRAGVGADPLCIVHLHV